MGKLNDDLFLQGALALGFIDSRQARYCQNLQRKYNQPAVKVLSRCKWITPGQVQQICEYISNQRGQFAQTIVETHPKFRNHIHKTPIHEPSISEDIEEEKEPLLPIQLQPGSYLGNYQIIEEAGRGGMGVIFKAKERGIERLVAVKVLLQLAPEIFERFLNEIKISAELDHPNIIKVYTAKVDNGIPYLVMAYIEGRTLADLLESQYPLTVTEKVEIIRQIAIALHYAHSKGIVHRDIKPDNIMITPEKKAMLMDFGIAQVSEEDQKLTRTGEVVGTPRYMPPERIVEDDPVVDAQSDVYSLGAVLYEALCYFPMVPGEHPVEIMQAIELNEPIPLCHLNPDLPESLETIWRRAVAKKRVFRYRDADAMAQDLELFLHDQPLTKRHYPIPVSSRKLRIITISLFGLVLLFAGFFIYQVVYSRNSSLAMPTEEIGDQSREQQGISLPLVTYLKRQQYYEVIAQKINTSATISEVEWEQIAGLIVSLVAWKDYRQAIAYYKRLPAYMRQRERLLLARGKAHYHLGEQEIANEYLQQLLARQLTPAIGAEAHFYLGLIKYHRQNFAEASDEFRKSEAVGKKLQVVPLYSKSLFSHLGACHFEEGQFSRAFAYLQKATDDEITYQYLGRYHLQMASKKTGHHLTKARNYLQKCLSCDPENSHFNHWYAKVLELEGHSEEAYLFFKKALALDVTNIAALQGVLRLSQSKTTLRIPGIHLLQYHVQRISMAPQETAPNLFMDTFRQIAVSYRSHYLQWRQLQQSSRDLQIFIDRLAPGNSEDIYNNAVEALITHRHQKDFDTYIERAMAQRDFPDKEVLLAISSYVKKRRRYEDKLAMIYRVAQLYLTGDLAMKNEIDQLGKAGQQLIEEILRDQSQKDELRYMAANTLLLLNDEKAWAIINKGAQENDLTIAALCVCVLYERRAAENTPDKREAVLRERVLWKVCSSDAYSPFLRSLVAINLSPLQSAEYLNLLQQDPDVCVRLYAAVNLLRYSPQRKNRDVLWQSMPHPNARFRQFSHRYFWHYLEKREQKIAIYQQRYREGLLDQDDDVKIAVLLARDNLYYPQLKKELTALAYSKRPLLQLMALETLLRWQFHDVLKTIIFDTSQPAIIRMFALLRTLERDSKHLFDWQRDIPRLLYDSDPHMRSFLFYLLSELGDNTLAYLQRESNPDVRATLLLTSGYKPLLGKKVNFYLAKLWQEVLERWHPGPAPARRPESIQKFLRDPSDDIRQATAMGMVMMANNYQGDIESVYSMFFDSDDAAIREGAALGFYYLVRRSVYEAMAENSHKLSAEQFYALYLDKMVQQARKPQLWGTYKQHLLRCINLCDKSEYRLEHALLYRLQNRLDLAKWNLEKAVELSPDQPQYLIELAIVEKMQANHRRAEELLDKILALDSHNPITLQRCLQLLGKTGQPQKIEWINRQLYILDPFQFPLDEK